MRIVCIFALGSCDHMTGQEVYPVVLLFFRCKLLYICHSSDKSESLAAVKFGCSENWYYDFLKIDCIA